MFGMTDKNSNVSKDNQQNSNVWKNRKIPMSERIRKEL